MNLFIVIARNEAPDAISSEAFFASGFIKRSCVLFPVACCRAFAVKCCFLRSRQSFEDLLTQGHRGCRSFRKWPQPEPVGIRACLEQIFRQHARATAPVSQPGLRIVQIQRDGLAPLELVGMPGVGEVLSGEMMGADI